jgi:hypothetical protein
MLTGPLSNRVNCIFEKPSFLSVEKETHNHLTSTSHHLENPQIVSHNPQELWDVTQINCPIPPRCPDRWI